MRRIAGNYFAEGPWRSTHPHSVRRAGNYHRTISTYLTAVLDHGFALWACDEPVPTDAVRAEAPHQCRAAYANEDRGIAYAIHTADGAGWW